MGEHERWVYKTTKLIRYKNLVIYKMILLIVLIILFIILLWCKYRLSTEEKYTINSLGIDWRNKAGVSDSVNKWILVLYDKDGKNIHQTEDKSPQNLQNFMDVSLNAIENKKFGSEIIGTNTLSVYYNSISDETKVYSGEVSLDSNDFNASLSDITTKDSDIQTWGELKAPAETLDEILGTKGTKVYAYPKGSTKDLYKCINTNACDIYDPKWWVRKTCFILELGFEKTGDIGYFYPYFPGLGHTHKYFGVKPSSKEVTMTCKEDEDEEVKKCSIKPQKFYLEKPEGVTDTDTVKYGQFVYIDTNGDKYYIYLSSENKLKVAELSDISDTSSTIFEFRYSKDCESYWKNVKKDEENNNNWKFGSEVYDCGPDKNPTIHNCQRWEHVRIDAVGDGEACPSGMKQNRHVIKTQWPKETTIEELNTKTGDYLTTVFESVIAGDNIDPNKNKDIASDPQYYKNQYDAQNKAYADAKAKQDAKTEISTGFKWYFYKKHLKNKSEFSSETPSRSGEGITDLSWKNIIKELGISGTPHSDQGPTARKRITGGVAGNYGSNYSIHFTGTYIPKKSGTYEFQTTSDDMSFLYIDDELIVDNGGLHWFVEKQGKKTLTEGKSYKIDIYFSEKGGDDGIDVEIKYPGDGNWSHIFDFTTLKNVRYVWFGYENSDWERPLNISQIEVYSGGVNIVKGFGDDTVDQDSYYADWTSPKRLFDGTLTTMAHTKDGKTNWFRIDLGKEYSVIDKVMVYNRMNPWWCCKDRWAGSFVKLLDSDKNLIVRSNETLPTNRNDAKNYTEDPDGAGETYLKTFTFPGLAATTSSLSTTPTNQDCEGYWTIDPSGRSKSDNNNNYRTMKYVVTKPKSGTGKDCKWAFVREAPKVGATDVTRNWAGWIQNTNDKWKSEVITDGQKAEHFSYWVEKGGAMDLAATSDHLKYCMRHPNINNTRGIEINNKEVTTDAYGTEKIWLACDDTD
jgi:fibro-slime domain-containing protein